MVGRMTESDTSFESALRVSPEPVIGGILGLAVVFALAGDSTSDPHATTGLFNLSLLCYALAPFTWLLYSWKPLSGRWSAIIALAAIILGANAWLDVPGLPTLLSIPTSLAAALISLPAATAVAVTASFLALLLPRWVGAGIGLTAI